MNVLAIDQGSIDLGLALLSEEAHVLGSTAVHAKPARSWLERMTVLDAGLASFLEGYSGRYELPQAVAIESVALYMNAATLAIMAQTRGYLIAACVRLLPMLELVVDVPNPTVRAFVGATVKVDRGLPPAMKREAAKQVTREFVARATGLADLSEDECDAVAIGLCAVERGIVKAASRPRPRPS